MDTKIAATEPRRLNMEEKRKLEKIIFADIAINEYSATRAAERSKMLDGFAKDKDIQALFAAWQKAKAEAERKSKLLSDMGFSIYSHGDAPHVYVSEASKIPAARKHQEQTAKTRDALQDLKRTYTLKLFAGGEEADELFAALSRELKAIIAA